VLAALSTGSKIGLALVAAIFIAFALASSFLFPRWRPSYPGRGGMGAFIAVSVVLFLAMLGAVEVFAKESEEPEQEGTTEQAEATSGPTTIRVTETEWKIALPSSDLKPGHYRFELTNDGKQPHNLTIDGPEVEDAATPTIPGGKTADLRVALVAGEYELYCSVPGHKEAGMDLKVTVA
jgi:uncharacterized cupredoxin-like copper-binding protein